MGVKEIILPDGIQRFVRIETLYDSKQRSVGEDIQLFESQGKIFEITSGRESPYLGCGIDVTQSFAKWLGIDLCQKEIASRHVKTRSIPPFKGIFTIPSWLSSGLAVLLDQKFPEHYGIQNFTAENTTTFLDIVTRQLKQGFPVITLVNHGKHWVMIVGIRYDASKITLRVIDNCITGFIEWDKSGILGWGKKLVPHLVRAVGYRSYKEGILISISAKKTEPTPRFFFSKCLPKENSR